MKNLELFQPKVFLALSELIELDAAGGHCEAFSSAHREAMIALMEARLVHRVTYKAGLVIYEITDAGRRMSQAWLAAEKDRQKLPDAGTGP